METVGCNCLQDLPTLCSQFYLKSSLLTSVDRHVLVVETIACINWNNLLFFQLWNFYWPSGVSSFSVKNVRFVTQEVFMKSSKFPRWTLQEYQGNIIFITLLRIESGLPEVVGLCPLSGGPVPPKVVGLLKWWALMPTVCAFGPLSLIE